MSGYLEEISSFICNTQFDDLPPETVERALQVTADTYAVIAAGAQEQEVKKLTGIINTSSVKSASLLGAGHRSEPLKAAFINGTAGTFLELDEGSHFSRGHPAVHVVPAALAIAEENSFSGKDFLTALILGYEVGSRIGTACKLRSTVHPHGTWGTVCAAVAVAKLMGYEEPAMKEVINISSAISIASSRRTMLEGGLVRNTYAGYSNENGIMTHYLYSSGFCGEKDGLQTVFGSIVSEEFSVDKFMEELGSRYEITRNYFKGHACCRYNHATIDALKTLLEQEQDRKLTSASIERIEVKTYNHATLLNDQKPGNTLAAKFSIPFAAAAYIVTGSGGVDSFTYTAINNPEIRELALRVTVAEDPDLTDMWPERRASRVKVTLRNGEVLEAENLINRGDSEDPYSAEELKEKYYSVLQNVYPEEVAENLYSGIMNLAGVKNINEVTEITNPANL